MRFVSLMIVAVLMTACASKPVLPENLVQAQVMTDNNLTQATEQSAVVQDAKQAVISAQKAEKQAEKADRKAERAAKRAEKAQKRAEARAKRAEARRAKAAKRAEARAKKLAKVDEMIEQ